MKHITLKPSRKISLNFDTTNLKTEITVSEESTKVTKNYITSNNLSDEEGFDIMLIFEKAIILSFDYLHKDKKIIFPELNPSTIFYSNSILSYGMLNHYRDKLLSKAYGLKKTGHEISMNQMGDYFNLSINCIINLQAAVESFLNYTIAEKYIFLDKKNKPRNPNIHDKIDEGIIEVTKKKDFELNFKTDYDLIKELIKLRNNIIHLKPDTEITNTKFKIHYRKIIDFPFEETINAVKNYINYYEPNLIEDCPCGKEFMYDIIENKNVF